MPIIPPKIPDGMVELMKTLAKNVLQEKPENINEYAAMFFENLLIERDGSLDKGYGKFRSYEKYCDFMEKMRQKGKRKPFKLKNNTDNEHETDSGVGSSNTDDETSKMFVNPIKPSLNEIELKGIAIQATNRKSKTTQIQQQQQRKVKHYSMNPKLKAQGSIERDRTQRLNAKENAKPVIDKVIVNPVDVTKAKKSKSKPRKMSSKKPSENLIVIKEETSADVADDDDTIKMAQSAVIIQRAYRSFSKRKVVEKFNQLHENDVKSGITNRVSLTENAAAIIIQTLFKSFILKKQQQHEISSNNKRLQEIDKIPTDSNVKSDEDFASDKLNVTEFESILNDDSKNLDVNVAHLVNDPILHSVDEEMLVQKIKTIESIDSSGYESTLSEKSFNMAIQERSEVLVNEENVTIHKPDTLTDDLIDDAPNLDHKSKSLITDNNNKNLQSENENPLKYESDKPDTTDTTDDEVIHSDNLASIMIDEPIKELAETTVSEVSNSKIENVHMLKEIVIESNISEIPDTKGINVKEKNEITNSLIENEILSDDIEKLNDTNYEETPEVTNKIAPVIDIVSIQSHLLNTNEIDIEPISETNSIAAKEKHTIVENDSLGIIDKDNFLPFYDNDKNVEPLSGNILPETSNEIIMSSKEELEISNVTKNIENNLPQVEEAAQIVSKIESESTNSFDSKDESMKTVIEKEVSDNASDNEHSNKLVMLDSAINLKKYETSLVHTHDVTQSASDVLGTGQEATHSLIKDNVNSFESSEEQILYENNFASIEPKTEHVPEIKNEEINLTTKPGEDQSTQEHPFETTDNPIGQVIEYNIKCTEYFEDVGLKLQSAIVETGGLIEKSSFNQNLSSDKGTTDELFADKKFDVIKNDNFKNEITEENKIENIENPEASEKQTGSINKTEHIQEDNPFDNTQSVIINEIEIIPQIAEKEKENINLKYLKNQDNENDTTKTDNKYENYLTVSSSKDENVEENITTNATTSGIHNNNDNIATKLVAPVKSQETIVEANQDEPVIEHIIKINSIINDGENNKTLNTTNNLDNTYINDLPQLDDTLKLITTQDEHKEALHSIDNDSSETKPTDDIELFALEKLTASIAALNIQRTYRGYRVRRHLKANKAQTNKVENDHQPDEIVSACTQENYGNGEREIEIIEKYEHRNDKNLEKTTEDSLDEHEDPDEQNSMEVKNDKSVSKSYVEHNESLSESEPISTETKIGIDQENSKKDEIKSSFENIEIMAEQNPYKSKSEKTDIESVMDLNMSINKNQNSNKINSNEYNNNTENIVEYPKIEEICSNNTPTFFENPSNIDKKIMAEIKAFQILGESTQLDDDEDDNSLNTSVKESIQKLEDPQSILHVLGEFVGTHKTHDDNRDNTINVITDHQIDRIDEANEANETNEPIDLTVKDDIVEPGEILNTSNDKSIEVDTDQTKKQRNYVTFEEVFKSSDSDDTTIQYRTIPYDPLSSDLSESDEGKTEKFKESGIDETSRDERDDLSEIENFDLSSCGEDSLEAMYYSLRKNELMVDKMYRRASEQRNTADEFFEKKIKSLDEHKTSFPDPITDELGKVQQQVFGRTMSKSAESTASDNDDVVMINLSVEDNSAVDACVEIKAQNNKIINLEKEVNVMGDEHKPDKISKDNVDNSTQDKEDVDGNIMMDPMAYAMKQKEVLLHRLHGNNVDGTRSMSDDRESIDEFPEHLFDDMKRGNIQRKMWASSVSESDSDYIEPTINRRLVKDDFNISSALDHITSTDSDSTIISAATKIQAGARGFLTRRRLRRSSMGTTLSADPHCSIGNAAIDKSLEDLIEQQKLNNLDDAAQKIQKSYRKYRAKKLHIVRDDTLDISGDNSADIFDDEDKYDDDDGSVDEKKCGITQIKLEQKKIEPNENEYENCVIISKDHEEQLHPDVNAEKMYTTDMQLPENINHLLVVNFDELDTAQRRMTLQRGDAVQRNSTPEEIIDLTQQQKLLNENGKIISVKSINAETGENDASRKDENKEVTSPPTISDSTAASKRSKNRKSAIVKGLGQRQHSMPVQIDTEYIRIIPKHLRKRVKSAESNKKNN